LPALSTREVPLSATNDHLDPTASARKRALRERALAARDALPAAARAAKSARITTALLELAECSRSRSVMAYVPVRSEFDTRALLERLLAAGVLLALPRITAPRLMEAVPITDLSRDLVPGRFGIPAPRQGLEPVSPSVFDCVVVPGSAFDLQGRRCGYGGGYYDGLLSQTKVDCHRVAAAFEAQLVDEVPQEPHDLPVHLIVTESRVVDLRP
jgi:5-formyltetrahydrofolate cyclo-ligase